MKLGTLPPILYTCLIVCSLSSSLYFYHLQKKSFAERNNIFSFLKEELSRVENDILFLKENEEEINIISKSGWLKSNSRLKGAQILKKYADHLHKICFIIEPQYTQKIGDKFFFKVSKIVVEASAFLDTHIYDFVENILKNFPGFLLVRRLSIQKNETKDPSDISTQHPNFVASEITYEWLEMDNAD